MPQLTTLLIFHLFYPRPPTLHCLCPPSHKTRDSGDFCCTLSLTKIEDTVIAAHGSSGHRLFISAFTTAPKVICDDTYSNKSWCIVAQGMFALREINQMEREMCSYLKWQLNVEPSALTDFEARIRRDFKGPGPYPPQYVLSVPLRAPLHGIFSNPKPSTDHVQYDKIPSFTTGGADPPPPSSSSISQENSSRRSSANHYFGPTRGPQLPTPPMAHSDVSSPADSMSPTTPPDPSRSNARIVSSTGSNTIQFLGDNVSPPYHHIRTHRSSSPVAAHQKNRHIDTKHISPKKSSDANPTTVYVFAQPCIW